MSARSSRLSALSAGEGARGPETAHSSCPVENSVALEYAAPSVNPCAIYDSNAEDIGYDSLT